MNVRTIAAQLAGQSQTAAAVRKRLLQVAAALLVQAAALFIAAGRLRWGGAWAYIGLYLGSVAVTAVTILPKDPELIAERGQLAENTKGWDRLLTALFGLSSLATLIVAGLEVRFGRSRGIASSIRAVSAVFIALGHGLLSWSMASNRFFSTMVRLQKERGHVVATGGPYRYLRHPGYAGMIASSLATPLLLGSRWGLIPGGITGAIFVVRTVLEDRTLQKELDGYQGYAGRVRYRLLPGIW